MWLRQPPHARICGRGNGAWPAGGRRDQGRRSQFGLVRREFLAVGATAKGSFRDLIALQLDLEGFHEVLRRAAEDDGAFCWLGANNSEAVFARERFGLANVFGRSAASLEELRAAQMALLARRLRAERLDEILLFLGRCIGTKQ